jgi:hypothetical protein
MKNYKKENIMAGYCENGRGYYTWEVEEEIEVPYRYFIVFYQFTFEASLDFGSITKILNESMSYRSVEFPTKKELLENIPENLRHKPTSISVVGLIEVTKEEAYKWNK